MMIKKTVFMERGTSGLTRQGVPRVCFSAKVVKINFKNGGVALGVRVFLACGKSPL